MNFSQFTTLIIDIHAEYCAQLRTMLEPLCQVLAATSSEDARKHIRTQAVHLIFLRVDDLPDAMDGLTIGENLAQSDEARNIPLIFVSHSKEFAAPAYKLGAVDFLLMPLDPNLLRNRLQSHRAIFNREELLAQSLDQLKVSEQRLSYALEATQEGLWDWHISTNTMYFSPPFEAIIGIPTGSLAPTLESLFSRLHPDEEKCVKAAYQRLADGVQPRLELEYQMRNADGNWIWVLACGKVVEHEWRRSYNAAGEKNITSIPLRAVGTISDITVRVAVDQQLRLSASVIEQMSDALAILNADETIISVNPAFIHATGYHAAELIGKPIAILKSGRHSSTFFAAIRTALRENRVWKGEIWNRRANGEYYPEWLNVSVLLDTNGEIKHYICIYSDLSTQDHVRRRLYHLSYYDALTGLPNREMLHDRLASVLADARRSGQMVAVLLLDLDRFKDINENLGHHIGDELLIQVSARLQNCIANGDTVARLGGDEFAVLIQNAEDIKSVAALADRIRDTIHTPFDLARQILFLSVSIGISVYPQDGSSLEELLRNADLALYQAKELGRNTYQFCSAQLVEAAQESFNMSSALRLAFDRQEFILYFQPLINLQNNHLAGAEVLVRWQPSENNPTAAIISPGRFLPIAEKAGLMAALDNWILTSSCCQIRDWLNDGFMLPRIAVNLSRAVLEHNDLTNTIINILQASHLPEQCLELEISEGFIMARAEYAISALVYLRQSGISLSIDDFGTGYSSLNYLKRLPINHLKIDQSFVRDLPNDPHDASIARAIIALGKSLGLGIIAEGIEQLDQLDFLRREGCDEGQGFFFGRPMPAKEFRAWAEQYQLTRNKIPIRN